MKIIRYLSYLLRAVLFLLFLLFAARNMEPVALNFFLGQTWQLPLIVLLLIFLVFGAALGVLAWLPRVFRDKREIQALRRRLDEQDPAEPAPKAEQIATPPPADAVL
jgi:uncharacterized integral membrane protein